MPPDPSIEMHAAREHRRSPRTLAAVRLVIHSSGESLELVTAVINLHGALILTPINWPQGTMLTIQSKKRGLAFGVASFGREAKNPPDFTSSECNSSLPHPGSGLTNTTLTAKKRPGDTLPPGGCCSRADTSVVSFGSD